MSDLRKFARQKSFGLWSAAFRMSNAQKNANKEKKRRRKTVKFSLNVSSPEDRALYDLLMVLKSQSLLAPYIRNGVALYTSLVDGESLDILFEMFGWIKEVIAPQTDAMLALSRQMQTLERMMKKSGHTQIPFSKQLSLLDEDKEDFDTEELRVATKKSDGDVDSVSAFLSAFGKV